MRILIAEDERDLNRVIAKKMKSEGYIADTCFDGEEALEFLKLAEYDVALVDVMMPKLDGFKLVEKARRMGIDTPVIFLTARDTIDDRVKGLDLGANDYVVKPFAFEELLARIRVAARIAKASVPNNSNVFSVDNLTLDLGSHKVTREGKEIELTAKEYALLEVLIRNKGKVLSREQIENNIWDIDASGTTNAVDVYIRYLRKKVDEPYDKKLIKTVRGAGYMLND